MADKKITDYDAAASLALTDLIEAVVDPSGSPVSKKATFQQVATVVGTDTDLADAISKKHSQNTDTKISLTEAPGSDHTATGVIGTFTAGESLVFGNLCYMKSDSKLWKTDADAAATMPGIAMALASISADATGPFLFLGVVRDDSWAWTVGGMIYASTTAGALTQTAPSGSTDIVQVVGVATHADRMYFKPDLLTAEVS